MQSASDRIATTDNNIPLHAVQPAGSSQLAASSQIASCEAPDSTEQPAASSQIALNYHSLNAKNYSNKITWGDRGQSQSSSSIINTI